MSWTNWRKIANKQSWYDDELDYDGPSCYELGIGGPNYGGIEPVYIGETNNEMMRMKQYARNGSHLSEIIDDTLSKGYSLYYRALALQTKREAKQMQDSMLSKFKYDWNIISNINDSD